MTSRSKEAPEIPLSEKVHFLKQAQAYPDSPHQVESIETHMSWVFLTDRYAYKLKKPVVYDFLDFGTVERRLFDCHEEVRLNRRLAPDVYLGVIALTVHRNGALQLQGGGRIADWLVKMRRLRSDLMLDRAIRNCSWKAEDIQSLAVLLSDFYRKATSVTVSPESYRKRLQEEILLNYRELSAPEHSLPGSLIEEIKEAQLGFLNSRPELLNSRAREGRIVEGHGDLRPEHVCLEKPPCIIDCLEFRREFRLMDPAEELAFLAMECESLGASSMGWKLLWNCFELVQIHPPPELVRFYAGHRASIRARLCIWHLKEPEFKGDRKWREKAERYLGLAAKLHGLA